MSKKLIGKVAIVTGGSKGIGASIAEELAEEGASVVVNYSTSKEDADIVVQSIKRKGGKSIAIQANMTNQKDIDRLFSETEKIFGKLDVLINNAGFYEFASLEKITVENFHKHFDLNVFKTGTAVALRRCGQQSSWRSSCATCLSCEPRS